MPQRQRITDLTKEERRELRKKQREALLPPFHAQDKRIHKAITEIANDDTQPKVVRIRELEQLAFEIMGVWQEMVATLDGDELLQAAEARR